MPTITRTVDRRIARLTLMAAAIGSAVLLTGCKEDKKESKAATPASPSFAERVISATEQNIRASRSYPVAFRGVQAWSQVAPQKWAVCGLMTPFQESPDIFVPFVSVATVNSSADDQVTQYQFEHRIGATTSDASRVYAALVTYCFDKGGPVAGSMRGAPSPPPLPDSVPDPQAKVSPRDATKAAAAKGAADTAKPAPVTDAMPASGDVTMRQAANLRTDPHGSTIRVLAQGTPLHIFGQAPGGWYQVGDTAPWGWVHESMLTRRTP